MNDINYEELEKWRDGVKQACFDSFRTDAMLASLLVVLRLENEKYIPMHYPLPHGDSVAVVRTLNFAIDATVVAYMVIGEAKITFSDKRGVVDAMVLIYEDRLVSRTTAYEIIREDKYAVANPFPMDIPDGITFDLVVGHLLNKE